MPNLLILICFLIAMLLSSGMIPSIMLVTYRRRLFDPIDARKIHRDIVPRLGGVAFAPIQCFLFIMAMVFAIKISNFDLQVQSWALLPMFMVFLCGLGILFVVGVTDDLIGVRYQRKFAVHIIVAAFLPVSGVWINDFYGLFGIHEVPSWIGMPITAFLVVLIINAINLIDGLDGLCSGVVGAVCLVLGALFIYYGAWWHALFAFITLGLLIPFFYYNVFGVSSRRRRIFMGDTGSTTLGYSVAFLAISFAMNNTYIKQFSESAIVVAAAMLIVPVFDVARVMLVRFKAGKSMFKPDRNHLHHKFLRIGFSHREAMLAIIAMALFFCGFNILMVRFVEGIIVVLCDICLWVGVHYLLEMMLRKKTIRMSAEGDHFGRDSIQKSEIDLS